MSRKVRVSHDPRTGGWNVDLFVYDPESGCDIHEEDGGHYGVKSDAVSSGRDLARLRSALLRVENTDGSVSREVRPE